MSGSKQLSTEQKSRIQTLLADMGVSEVAKELGLSRNTIYRWKVRADIARKSRRPKTNTASLLPVQRDMIRELIRLSRWPKRELLPLVSRVFPVFKRVGEGGQRRLWKEVMGTGTLSPAQRDPDAPFYRSSFRVGAFFVAQEGGTLPPVCVLTAWETVSGVLVHRVVEGSTNDVTDFLLDLSHEWPFQIAEITLVSTESEVFPGLPGKHMSNVPKMRNAAISETFQRLWTKLPPIGVAASPRAGPQAEPPSLQFEVCANRSQIIWLPRRLGLIDLDGVKKVARSWSTNHNTRLRGERTKWLSLSRQVLTPEEYLIRAWEGSKMNGAVRDDDLPETRANLHLLLTQALVMYTKNKRARQSFIRRTGMAEKT
jgi:Homeodomain-like domain